MYRTDRIESAGQTKCRTDIVTKLLVTNIPPIENKNKK